MSRRSGGQAIGRGRGQKGKQQKGRHGEDELGRLEEEGLAEEKQEEKERKKDGQELDNATYGVMSGRSSLTLVENHLVVKSIQRRLQPDICFYLL